MNKDVITPENIGVSYSLEGGYNFESGFSFSLAYMKFDANDLLLDNLSGIVNYRFNAFGDYVPYFGALAGYSSLTWNANLLTSNSDSASSSDSPFVGSQAGIKYKGFESISLLLGYQCIFMNHTTNIQDDDNQIVSKLQHETLHSIQMGIQYNF